LCPHAAFGSASYQKGAIEEARRLIERNGGYDAMMDAIEHDKAQRRDELNVDRERRRDEAAASVRYDK
jgi:hypothetical protein